MYNNKPKEGLVFIFYFFVIILVILIDGTLHYVQYFVE